MSRGPGYLQRWLLENIARSDKAMTFNEILVAAYPEDYGIPGRSVERSLRRALRGLIGDGKMGAVIALGEGGLCTGTPTILFGPLSLATRRAISGCVLSRRPGGAQSPHARPHLFATDRFPSLRRQ
jgi:hypothetical protein